MIRDILKNQIQEIAINVQQSEIESIRKKDIAKTAIRVYDQDCIGIASGIGKIQEEILTKKAKEALDLHISYPVPPESNHTKTIQPDQLLLSEEEFLHEMRELLNVLRQQNPQFTFSNKLIQQRASHSLNNDVGLSLSHAIEFYRISLLINHQDSSNLFDAAMGYQSNQYNRTLLTDYIHEICTAYNNPIPDFQEGNYPILFDSSDQTYLGKLYHDLHGHIFATGSSLFSNRLGESIFNPLFSFFVTRSPKHFSSQPFFDLEGVFTEDFLVPLIQNGIMQTPYTDKKTAHKYQYPNTACGGGSYDSVPTIGIPQAYVPSTGKTTKEILQGEKGIVIVIASGGDFTPDGHFATPVQLAFLYDGNHLVGRLPQLSLSSELYTMFGDHFMGVSSNPLFPLDDSRQTILRMNVKKID
ncbi:MAG: metallopeptidase TldD-related protein [Caldisericia bacterium]|nr:metallopeptidase TldD-related protein [Caldisericia bacterium]